MGITQLLEDLPIDAPDDTIAECTKALDKFVADNDKTFSFGFLSSDEYNKLMKVICDRITSRHQLMLRLLTLLRLLSRDKQLVMSTKDPTSVIDSIITTYEYEDDGSPCVEVECLKCLCNWVYHSEVARTNLVQRRFFQTMFKNLKTVVGDEGVFYQIRLVFLISALDTTERANMIEYGIFTVLVDMMEQVLQFSRESVERRTEAERTLTELLRAMFNLTYEISNVTSPKVSTDCIRLASLSRTALLALYPFQHEDPNETLTHIANLFFNLPADACAKLTPVLDVNEAEVINDLPPHIKGAVYEDYDLKAIAILLEALETRINFQNYALMKEKTFTVLSSFSYICRLNRTIRKYLKDQVLPRIETSDKRPEEQGGLRGKIVKLMQDVDIGLKNMAADFLYVLCKENANRLVRYVGYGNAAGFLASRGLMMPSKPHALDGDYSDDQDSDHSDDEEKDPVTGARAIPKENVFANLTEEEKEKEIDNLISMTNRLKELDVIKPMGVKSDGTLVDPEKVQNNDDDTDSDY